jgi:hypothetical protein
VKHPIYRENERCIVSLTFIGRGLDRGLARAICHPARLGVWLAIMTGWTNDL